MATNLLLRGAPEMLSSAQSVEGGAAGSVYLATAAEVASISGQYAAHYML